MQTLALAFMAATAIGGLAWVFIYPLLSGERKAESRRASIARSEPAAARQADKGQRSRREQVEGSLSLVDVLERPFITVGMTVFLILFVLTLTSNRFAIRKLGRKWQTLHRLVYVAVVGGVLFASRPGGVRAGTTAPEVTPTAGLR